MTARAQLNARVLVVDDDPVVRESFRTALGAREGDDHALRTAASVLFDEAPVAPPPTDAGHGVDFALDVATSGAEGVAQARAAAEAGAPYAVIFCDVRMPGMDGVEAVEKIRGFDPRAEVVFVTAYSDHSVAHIADRAGDNVGYFVKPFLPDEMRQLATKLVLEWNRAREIESLVRAMATLRGERADVQRLLEHLLRQVCLWLDTDSAALLRRSPEGRFRFDLGVGDLRAPESVREVAARLDGVVAGSPGRPGPSTLPDGTVVLPIHEFGVAIALGGRARLTADRRFLLEVFLENAALALHNSEVTARLGEAERLAVVGRALGFVLHDVRNPVGTAQMLVRLLRTAPRDAAATAETLGHVEFELQRAVDLIGDTLALCRGQLDLRPRALDLAAVLRDPRAPWRTLLEHRGVRASVACSDAVPAYADRARLDRALANLVTNAAEAVAGRPDPAVEVGARRTEGGAEVWVADEGEGVPPTLLPMLFHPFATSGKEGGTGFGLAIVRQVAEAHGGRVTHARDGGRTRFTVFLPDAPAG